MAARFVTATLIVVAILTIGHGYGVAAMDLPDDKPGSHDPEEKLMAITTQIDEAMAMEVHASGASVTHKDQSTEWQGSLGPSFEQFELIDTPEGAVSSWSSSWGSYVIDNVSDVGLRLRGFMPTWKQSKTDDPYERILAHFRRICGAPTRHDHDELLRQLERIGVPPDELQSSGGRMHWYFAIWRGFTDVAQSVIEGVDESASAERQKMAMGIDAVRRSLLISNPFEADWKKLAEELNGIGFECNPIALAEITQGKLQELRRSTKTVNK